jgi:hypothetical protein
LTLLRRSDNLGGFLGGDGLLVLRASVIAGIVEFLVFPVTTLSSTVHVEDLE